MGITKNIVKSVAASAWIRLRGNQGEFAPLRDETVLVFKGDLSKGVCKELRDRIDEVLCDPSHPMVWHDGVGSDQRVWAFEREIADLLGLFQIERHLNAIEQYLARPVRSWFLMANRVVPAEKNVGSGGGLHRDSPFSNQVKCIWYLSDVGSENGPFEYLPGSHANTIASRYHYPLGLYRFERVHESDQMVEVVADAGSLLVCDTKCIHRGKPIDSGVRYAVTLYTSPHADGLARQIEGLGLPRRQASGAAKTAPLWPPALPLVVSFVCLFHIAIGGPLGPGLPI